MNVSKGSKIEKKDNHEGGTIASARRNHFNIFLPKLILIYGEARRGVFTKCFLTKDTS